MQKYVLKTFFVKSIVLILMIIFTFSSCQERSEGLEWLEKAERVEWTTATNCEELVNGPIESQVIIKFTKRATPSIIRAILSGLKEDYNVKLVNCDCDPSLVLVEFPEGSINPEDRKQIANDALDQEGSGLGTVFYNFGISLDAGETIEGNHIPTSTWYDSTDQVIVAIIDSGLGLQLSMFDGKMRLKTSDYPNGVDDDENGIIDDFMGHDFTEKYQSSSDILPHGTQVAGVILAEYPGDINLRLMDLQIFDEEGQSSLFDATCAMKYAIMEGADIINMSWGYYREQVDTLFMNTFREARNKNITIITSAGNNSTNVDICPHYPSNFDRNVFNLNNVIGVAALEGDQLASYSNYGQVSVGIAAPGHFESVIGNGWIEGTSYAAPYVTRAASIVLSKTPEIKNSALVNCILENSILIPGLPVISKGKLNDKLENWNCP